MNPADAPTISSVKINGLSVVSGDSLPLTTDEAPLPVTVVVDATDSSDTNLTYTLSSTSALLATSDAGTTLTTTLGVGDNVLF